MIFHLTPKKDWKQAITKGFYDTDSLYQEGFIHCSSNNQIMSTLHRYFENETDIMLLVIDESKLQSPLKYEPAKSIPEMFPHIYGPINLDAVIEVRMIR